MCEFDLSNLVEQYRPRVCVLTLWHLIKAKWNFIYSSLILSMDSFNEQKHMNSNGNLLLDAKQAEWNNYPNYD